jgi:hypothetical protein
VEETHSGTYFKPEEYFPQQVCSRIYSWSFYCMCSDKEKGTPKHSDQVLCLNAKVFWVFILLYFIWKWDAGCCSEIVFKVCDLACCLLLLTFLLKGRKNPEQIFVVWGVIRKNIVPTNFEKNGECFRIMIEIMIWICCVILRSFWYQT